MCVCLTVVQTTQKRLMWLKHRGRPQNAHSTKFNCVSGDDETSNLAEYIISEIVPAKAAENRSRVISDELSADTDNVDPVPKNASVYNEFDDQRSGMVTHRYSSQLVPTAAKVLIRFVL